MQSSFLSIFLTAFLASSLLAGPAPIPNAATGAEEYLASGAKRRQEEYQRRPPPGALQLQKVIREDRAEVREIGMDQVESLRLLGHWNIPLKVLMVASRRTTDEVQAMLEVVREIRQDTEQPGADKLRLHLITEDPSLLKRLDLTQEDLQGVVEVNRYFETGDIWLQDWGEVAAARVKGEEEDRLLILDTNRGRELAPLPAKLARLWDARFLKMEVESHPGNYGGNIEVLPEGTLVIGDSSSPALRQNLARLGYQDRLVVLESSWLRVGHVDEYLTFLPEPDSPLGFSIAKADPRRAMQLLARSSYKEMVKDFRWAADRVATYAGANPGLYQQDYQSLRDQLHNVGYVHQELTLPDEKIADDVRGWIAVNEEVATTIDRNVEKLLEALAQRHGGVRPDVVSIPVLFDTQNERSIAILPDSVNMIVLGRHLVIPDPLLSDFRNDIETTLGNRGHKVHLVPNWTYHSLDGQLHCGTSVFRHPNQYLFPPPNARASKQARFQQLFAGME